MTAPRLTALDFSGDPGSAAGNSPGSFEELFRSFGALGRGQPSEGWSEGLYELSPLSSKRSVRAYEKFLRQQARIAAGFVGEEGVEPSVQIIAARCSRLSHGGGQGPRRSNKHYNDSKHPRVALYTVFLYLSSYTSSVSSPVPWHLVQVAFFQGCNPVPPHSGQRIGSGTSFMALFVFVLFSSEGQAHCSAEAECP